MSRILDHLMMRPLHLPPHAGAMMVLLESMSGAHSSTPPHFTPTIPLQMCHTSQAMVKSVPTTANKEAMSCACTGQVQFIRPSDCIMAACTLMA